MSHGQSDKNMLSACVASIVCVMTIFAGCGNERQQTTTSRSAMGGAPASSFQDAPRDLDPVWDEELAHGLYDRSAVRESAQDRSAGARQPGRGQAPPSPAPIERSAGWSIVLGTFSGEGHELAAENMLRTLPQIDPRLSAARVERTRRGSLVVYGRYRGPDDPAAQRELEEIKAIEFRGQHVFPRAFLTRAGPGAAQRSPYALLSVRDRYPNVDPLYTLQVATWGDFESGEVSAREIQQRAEQYAGQLRSAGLDAYVHHDPQQQMSIVTVGLFDRTAIDPETGLMSRELRQLRERFPVHMVNGEEMHEPIDSRRPARGTRPQPPPLVLVPMQ